MRFTDSPYEDFMKEKSYFKGVPPNLPPKCCLLYTSDAADD